MSNTRMIPKAAVVVGGDARDNEVKQAVIDAATSGNNTLVAAVTGKRIRVISFFFIVAGAVTVRFESGTDGVKRTGVMSFAANGGIAVAPNYDGWFETAASTLLNMELGGAVQVSGALTYQEIEDA